MELCIYWSKKYTFSGGFFKIKINFPKEYPNKGPEVHFLTKIYHPNISFYDGRVCIDLLNKWSQKKTSMIKVLWAIYILLLKPNPDDPYNTDAAKLYKEKWEEYWKKANEFVRKFAHI